ncbi:MAG: hydrogenase maturation nickel metallochaperone HypA [Candidatus Omnitrophota bacterium]|nr:hydrogenase maturation nickel metallochaperone HypA [Candidatus Omnitrophota bacterium]MDZ4242840.1 hydrogenase maturation nickel metallochaperone HypA [Candidatus Omnitrophota bacterium]
MTHEMSLINNLVRKIEHIAAEQNALKVTAVTVQLGALSHISPGHFRGHFVEGVVGTVAEGARLDIEVGQDTDDPHAQEIMLMSVNVDLA